MKKTTPIGNPRHFRQLPTVTFQRQRICCGKPKCKCANGTGHGPYWYAFWETAKHKTTSRYVGKHLTKITIQRVIPPGHPLWC
jgi:hypothetical protein